jgi:hypothetical protein
MARRLVLGASVLLSEALCEKELVVTVAELDESDVPAQDVHQDAFCAATLSALLVVLPLVVAHVEAGDRVVASQRGGQLLSIPSRPKRLPLTSSDVKQLLFPAQRQQVSEKKRHHIEITACART